MAKKQWVKSSAKAARIGRPGRAAPPTARGVTPGHRADPPRSDRPLQRPRSPRPRAWHHRGHELQGAAAHVGLLYGGFGRAHHRRAGGDDRCGPG
jgi:hypothetical protein